MILVTGPTGNIGQHLIDDLLAMRTPVRALVRNPDSARALSARGVDVVVGSFADAGALRRALAGIERVFLLSPPGTSQMVDQQTHVVDRAREAGVRSIVKLSSIGADEETGAAMIRAHRDIEQHIERSGLAWTHLRPNWYMQNELGQATTIAAEGVFYAPDVTQVTMIDAADVAAAAARVLTSDGHDGKAYTLTGPQPLSYADLAGCYSDLLGRPVRWVEVTLDEARESMLTSGLPEVLATGFTQIMDRYRDGGATATVSADIESLLGRPARSFADFVTTHRDQFATAGVGTAR